MRKTVLLIAAVVSISLLASVGALADVVDGTAGDDTLTGTGRADFMYGYGGADTILGDGGDDELWGGSDLDILKGGSGKDTLHGEGGNDKLNGAPGDDELRGADGRDRLTGSGGDDRLYDRDGDDTVIDTFSCGPGTDTVQADPWDNVLADCENLSGDGDDLLPDLGMAQIQDIQFYYRGDGSRWLLFSSTIVNVGAGDFEATGRRAPGDSAADMETTQRIYDSAGGYRDRSTAATFFYAGDGHDHWHSRDLEDYELFSDDQLVGTAPKNGFCFYDNVLYGATGNRVYGSSACATGQPEALTVTMGLGRGWGDRYGPQQVGQGINTTGLADGDYRLRLAADGVDSFLEIDETNNFTWVDLRIQGSTVTVLQYGPSPPPVS